MDRKLLTAACCAALAFGWSAQAQQSGSSSQSGSGASTTTPPANQSDAQASGPGMNQLDCNSSFAITDTNNDGMVTQDEFQQWNQAGFSALDQDGNGELSRQEYVDCMGASMAGPVMSDRSSEDMASADTDASGDISAEEYMQATNQAHQQAATGSGDGIVVLRRYIFVPANLTDQDIGSMSDSEVAANSARQFRMLDTDRSNSISDQEWTATENADVSESLGQDFDTLDADRSGSVSQQEYDDAMGQRWSTAEQSATSGMSGGGSSTGAGSTSGSSSGSASGSSTTSSGASGSDSASNSSAQAGQSGDRGDLPSVYYFYFTPTSQN